MIMATRSRTLENRMWSRVFDDGLWDLYLGVLFANIAVWMTAVELGWPYGSTAIPTFIVLMASYALFTGAKRRITLPRVGYFKPARKRRTTIGAVGTISVSLTVLMVATTILAAGGAFSEGIPLSLVLFGVLALKMVILFSLAGHFMGVSRFYAYALLGAVGMVGAEIAGVFADVGRGWDVAAMFGGPAVVMLPTGVVLLTRFLKTYPVAEHVS